MDDPKRLKSFAAAFEGAISKAQARSREQARKREQQEPVNVEENLAQGVQDPTKSRQEPTTPPSKKDASSRLSNEEHTVQNANAQESDLAIEESHHTNWNEPSSRGSSVHQVSPQAAALKSSTPHLLQVGNPLRPTFSPSMKLTSDQKEAPSPSGRSAPSELQPAIDAGFKVYNASPELEQTSPHQQSAALQAPASKSGSPELITSAPKSSKLLGSEHSSSASPKSLRQKLARLLPSANRLKTEDKMPALDQSDHEGEAARISFIIGDQVSRKASGGGLADSVHAAPNYRSPVKAADNDDSMIANIEARPKKPLVTAATMDMNSFMEKLRSFKAPGQISKPVEQLTEPDRPTSTDLPDKSPSNADWEVADAVSNKRSQTAQSIASSPDSAAGLLEHKATESAKNADEPTEAEEEGKSPTNALLRRTATVGGIPDGQADEAFAALCVFGGPLDKLTVVDGTLVVSFVREGDCQRFVDKSCGGLVWNIVKGRPQTVDVAFLDKTPDDAPAVLPLPDATRCLRAYGPSDAISAANAERLPWAKKLHLAWVMDGRRSRTIRQVDFRFHSIQDAAAFKSVVSEEPGWDEAVWDFVADPCDHPDPEDFC